MDKSKKPPKWASTYPQGTKEGDEEQRFFIALSRHKKWEWRSVAHIAKEAKLTELRIEELLDKYQRKGMVFQNPKNEVYWGYWERVPKMLPKEEKGIVEKDQSERLKKAMGCCCTKLKKGDSLLRRDYLQKALAKIGHHRRSAW